MQMKGNGFAKWTAALFVLLLVNTAYIAAFASPTIFYMANVLLHLVLGVVLAVAFGRAAGAGRTCGRASCRRRVLFLSRWPPDSG